MSQTHMDQGRRDESHRDETQIEVGAKEVPRTEKFVARNAGTPSPVLDAALLAQVRQLNLDYLELLVAEHAASECATQLQHLPPRQRTALGALPARGLRLIAAASYSLYSLGFEDGNFWQSICTDSTEAMPNSIVQRYARTGDATAQYAFCKLALLHAWHLATSNPLAARMVYAMPHATSQRLAATPLWQIRCIASNHATLLMPRWPTNPAFWPDLIRFAAANDQRRMPTARLLGTQLIAAELELACAMSRRDPRIAPCIASPRLRARKLQMEPRGR